MAWKESADASGVPKLDFQHPRIIAAMKVTGIQESYLKSKPRALKGPAPTSPYSARAAIADGKDSGADKDKIAGGASTARSETLARSKDLWERKQHQLLRELEATADALDDADVDAILEPRGAHTDGDNDAKGEHRHKEQVEQMRERLRAQLRREAQREIDHSSAQETAAKNREARAKLLEEQAKEQREELTAKIEKKVAQHQKVQARVKEGLKSLKHRRDEISSKLGAANERVDKMLQERASGETGKHQELRSRLAKIAEQKMASEEAELERKARRCEEALRHDEIVEERLIQAREDERTRLEERRLKFRGALDKVNSTQQQQEREREKNFLDNARKLNEARQASAAKAKEAMEASQGSRDKQLAKWQTNRQQAVQRKREHMKNLKAKLSESFAKADDGRDRYYEEQVLTRAANRGMLQDIVEQNKSQIARGDETARKQTLAKIEREMARTEATAAQKKQLRAYRMLIIKESMEGKMRVEELRRLDPSGGDMSSRRINDILQSLDMQPLPSSRVKDGEEGQQQ